MTLTAAGACQPESEPTRVPGDLDIKRPWPEAKGSICVFILNRGKLRFGYAYLWSSYVLMPGRLPKEVFIGISNPREQTNS